jgi:ribosomal protein L7/L12
MKIVVLVGVFLFVVLVLRIMGSRGGESPEIHEPPSDESIRRSIAGGRKIQAIKDYRKLHNVGLREAKDAVEELARTLHP